MSKIFRIFMILVFVAMSLPATSAQAAPIPTDEAKCALNLGIYGSTPDGSNFCLWLPTPAYEGDLLIFAHGYVDPLTPNGEIPWDQLALTTPSLPVIVTSQLHTAFAITSYAHNGLAVVEGVTAVTQLATALKMSVSPKINNIYLVGASEGGLVTTQAIELNPGGIFSGGVTTCGPTGDFKAQVNYWGDFRVVFDYFFQGLRTKLADPVWIQNSTRANWGVLNPTTPTPLQPEIIAALAASPAATTALLSVSKAPFDPAVAATIPMTVLGILDYNVRATNQARNELSADLTLDGSTNKGNPFGNNGRIYSGAGVVTDALMNEWIQANDEFTADPNALVAIQAAYQTTGKIKAPLVAMHTIGDPIVPFWHATMYQKKIWAALNGSKFFNIPISRYGHCAFTAKEAVFAYMVMVKKATGTLPTLPLTSADPSVLTSKDFTDMMLLYGAYNYIPMYFPIISK
jgi:hypothetical protein